MKPGQRIKAPLLGELEVDPIFLSSGGRSQVYRASRGADRFFVKTFVTPKRNLTVGSAKRRAQQLKTCEVFEGKQGLIYDRLKPAQQACDTLIPMRDFFRIDSVYAVVYDFIELVDVKAPFEEQEADRYGLLLDAAQALLALHQQGIVHVDIKPSNIAYRIEATYPTTKAGRSSRRARKILRAVLIDCDGGVPVGAIPGRHLGLIDYDEQFAAPEVISFFQRSATSGSGTNRLVRDTISPRSDIFSFSLTALDVLTGRVPQQAGARLLDGATEQTLHRELDMNGLFPGVREVILQGLAADAARRPSAYHFVTALQSALAGNVRTSGRTAKPRSFWEWLQDLFGGDHANETEPAPVVVATAEPERVVAGAPSRVKIKSGAGGRVTKKEPAREEAVYPPRLRLPGEERP